MVKIWLAGWNCYSINYLLFTKDVIAFQGVNGLEPLNEKVIIYIKSSNKNITKIGFNIYQLDGN